jgi:CheY-like chemotaxis protein
VLVSDIAMPDEDGYDFLRAIRGMPDARARIPAVALTSFSGVSTERRTRIVGFQRCLFKPVESSLLASTVHEVWRDRQS